MYEDEWPCLIVCPSSARYHWKFELLQLMDHLSLQKITVGEWVPSTWYDTQTTPISIRNYVANLVASLEDNLT